METKHVVVLGAGVIGLQCAFSILQSHHAQHTPISLTILAKHLPGDRGAQDYASPWAGAHWRPHSNPSQDPRQCRWDIATYNHWRRLHAELPTAQTGLRAVLETILFDASPLPETATWFAPHVEGYRILEKHELQDGCAAGAVFTTFAINVPRYLAYLMQRVEELGARLVRCTLPLDQGMRTALSSAAVAAGVESTRSMFVNALGIAAGRLCSDENVYPIRGQTMLVIGEASGCVTRQGPVPGRSGQSYISYMMPRPGSGKSVLGGTNEAHVWSVEEDQERDIAKAIVQRAEVLGGLVNGLRRDDGELELMGTNWGCRPARKGGARVEVEMVEGVRVVHAYGLGGAGYQNSVGLGKEVAGLVWEGVVVGSRL